MGFDRLDVASLVAITTPANLGSQHVLRKTGLRYERDIVHTGVPHLLFRISATKL
jgi:RimJ/RimL family protein N-acetyltransferase